VVGVIDVDQPPLTLKPLTLTGGVNFQAFRTVNFVFSVIPAVEPTPNYVFTAGLQPESSMRPERKALLELVLTGGVVDVDQAPRPRVLLHEIRQVVVEVGGHSDVAPPEARLLLAAAFAVRSVPVLSLRTAL
jgi:hypothetical protein